MLRDLIGRHAGALICSSSFGAGEMLMTMRPAPDRPLAAVADDVLP
jgi:hypothetical protein